MQPIEKATLFAEITLDECATVSGGDLPISPSGITTPTNFASQVVVYVSTNPPAAQPPATQPPAPPPAPKLISVPTIISPY